ncbi:MAG: hypothetical protein JSW00_08195 [Thermoplasmata archaeon]|nr:MAG: hypothetical protein JSW00_08195 [Thermoplasmata archaeon]
MFYVSIPKKVLDSIMEKAKATDFEIIGLLVGYAENHTILIEEAITGEQDSQSTMASLHPKSIAEITDRILSGEIQGRIMGWYHSHPGFGLFMSPIDIITQRNFQQFSDYVTALIVDPKKEELAFFTLDKNENVIQLEDDQVHVFSDEKEKIPDSFSSPPKPPKPTFQTEDNEGEVKPLREEPKNSYRKIIAFVTIAVLLSMLIGGPFVPKNQNENSKHSSVDDVLLFGELYKNQLGTPIFRDQMNVFANITVLDGRITAEGLRFYLGQTSLGWNYLGNVGTYSENSYHLAFDTRLHNEGTYHIKVNFTDTKGRTFEGMSELFVIDNTPDIPEPRFLEPRDGDEIDGVIPVYAVVADVENNVHEVQFFFRNGSVDWTHVNETHYDQLVYLTYFDTELLTNGTYQIKIRAEDRNLYIAEVAITVNVSHGG